MLVNSVDHGWIRASVSTISVCIFPVLRRQPEIRFQPPQLLCSSILMPNAKYWMAANFTNVKPGWQCARKKQYDNSVKIRPRIVTTFFSMLQFDFECVSYAVFALRRWKASNMLDGICIGCQKPTTWLNEEGALGSSFRILG